LSNIKPAVVKAIAVGVIYMVPPHGYRALSTKCPSIYSLRKYDKRNLFFGPLHKILYVALIATQLHFIYYILTSLRLSAGITDILIVLITWVIIRFVQKRCLGKMVLFEV